MVCTGLDITDRNQAEERVRFLPSYDPLTGLPNRRLVTEHLQQAIAATTDGQQLAVLIPDLDRFKDVNATWGRSAGDELLREVADRLARSLRLSDVLAHHDHSLRMELGRLGADEFSVLVPRVRDAKEVAALVERLQHALARPFKFEDQDFTVTASVGAALYPSDGSDAEMLLRNAEAAKHAAREKLRGSYHFYSVAMHASVSESLSLETELRRGGRPQRTRAALPGEDSRRLRSYLRRRSPRSLAAPIPRAPGPGVFYRNGRRDRAHRAAWRVGAPADM